MLFIDFDNTMMATERYALPSLVARFNALYGTQAGTLLTVEMFTQHFHGLAREALCGSLSDYFKISVDCQALYAEREWHVMQHLQAVQGGIPMAPHLVETLALLRKQRNLRAALVSNNSVQRALCAMRYAANGQGEELAALLGTRLFEAGDRQKPLPDPYLHAMAQLNVQAQDAVAIEDSAAGARAATAAGLLTYGFTGFATDKTAAAQTLRTAGCRHVFDDWQDLPALLPDTLGCTGR